jgi:hypothetical protein
LVFGVRCKKAFGEGKPRIPSGIEGWAGFLPRLVFPPEIYSREFGSIVLITPAMLVIKNELRVEHPDNKFPETP